MMMFNCECGCRNRLVVGFDGRSRGLTVEPNRLVYDPQEGQEALGEGFFCDECHAKVDGSISSLIKLLCPKRSDEPQGGPGVS